MSAQSHEGGTAGAVLPLRISKDKDQEAAGVDQWGQCSDHLTWRALLAIVATVTCLVVTNLPIPASIQTVPLPQADSMGS